MYIFQGAGYNGHMAITLELYRWFFTLKIRRWDASMLEPIWFALVLGSLGIYGPRFGVKYARNRGRVIYFGSKEYSSLETTVNDIGKRA